MHPGPGSLQRRLAATLLAFGIVLCLTACGHEDEPERANDVAATPTATGATGTTGATSTAPSYPTYAPTDYTYRLEVLCYCPLLGPVDVTVQDGEVTTAVIATGPTQGKPAPDVARRSINDIIAIANDPKPARVDVTWPSGQDHPNAVKVDQIEHATDDEVTYTITNVRVSGE